MLDQAVRNMVKLAGRPVAEALQMVSDTPAAVLGLETKGKLAPQYDADLVVLDRDLKVILTMIRGQVVYRTNN
jgi:N-acetylglucosamine-6-phosphate deacetylase